MTQTNALPAHNHTYIYTYTHTDTHTDTHTAAAAAAAVVGERAAKGPSDRGEAEAMTC